MKTQERILNNLERVGFNKKEAEIFYDILKNPTSNGSQIAKRLGYPRTTVYQTLDMLQKKGCVKSFLDKEVTYYEAVDVDTFFEKHQKDIKSVTDKLKDELNGIKVNGKIKQFYNLTSYSDIKSRIKTILNSSEKEVYLNTNLDLMEYKKEFLGLHKKGVKVTLFTFSDENYDDLKINVLRRESFDIEVTDIQKRIMLVSDDEIALIGSMVHENFTGVFSENQLLVSIVKEHIKNDINLLKLERAYGKEINEVICEKK